MERRLILAIALSILIIIMFQGLAAKQARPPLPTAEPAAVTTPAKTAPSAVLATRLATETAADEKEIDVETDRYILTFSNAGGSIKKMVLKDYKESHSAKPMELAGIEDPKDYILAISDPLNIAVLDRSAYTVERGYNIIKYSLRTKNLEIIKTYILHNTKYGIELQLLIKNLSNAQERLNYRIIGGAGLSEPYAQDERFVEVMASINGKTAVFKKTKAERVINPGIVSWTALKNKYFSMILKPLTPAKSQFYSVMGKSSFVTGLEPQEVTLLPNSYVEQKYLLYAGPSRPKDLKAVDPIFEETIDYGFFGWISKPLVFVMEVSYKLVRNWGLAVIILSLLLNAALFPLSLKSFSSMQKMQALHPEMEKLKSQYKDNPQRLNKEIMELYKKYNINPFSGCLPLILQMPIFIALYNALIRSIDLRGAKFLWINDLSMPDAVKIPVTLPLIGNSINILPILMIAAMVIQQKISTKTMGAAVTEEQKQQQKVMLIVMPIMFGFIFYNMPSGLVLYWLVNTVMTVTEQHFIFKKA